MFSAKNTDERVCGTIFLRFRFAAQKLEARNSCAHAMFREGRRKLTSNAKEGHKSSKIKAFRPPKSSLGASGRPKIEPEGARSSAETRSKRPRGLRKFICQRERASSSEKARPRASEERAGPRGPRGKISESSNGLKQIQMKVPKFSGVHRNRIVIDGYKIEMATSSKEVPPA